MVFIVINSYDSKHFHSNALKGTKIIHWNKMAEIKIFLLCKKEWEKIALNSIKINITK